MTLPEDWRELLGRILAESSERERIASEIGVHVGTLMRWVNGDSNPRQQNLRQLLRALPKQQRNQLAHQLPLSDLTGIDDEKADREIPYPFIMEVLEMRANTTDQLRSWTITRHILQQALKQLDPERVGMSISVVRCMPPKDGKIRSLRESEGLGTPPWGGDLEEKALLLGAESLAGHVTSGCRIEQVGDLKSKRIFLPAYRAEYEVSSAACPIMYGSRVAGCLLLSSIQTNYFASEDRLTLIRAYAHLLALAFDPQEFYDPAILELHIMPPLEVQQAYFTDFRQRVLALIQASTNMGMRISGSTAEQLIWQEIEEAMLNHHLV
jgi:transcriptional regulator with XRE-family HTH domain